MNTLSFLQRRILQILAPGGFYSGERIAAQLGVSRAAVWKALHGIRALGMEINAVKGRGYCLVQPVELLEKESILRHLPPASRATLDQFDVMPAVDSTNAWLMRIDTGSQIIGCVAEHQSAGRGRRGRGWYSPFARNLYLSLRWHLNDGMGHLSGLSLAMAVATVRTLWELGVAGVRLKWPNDIYWRGRKLGGILVEVAGEAAGPCVVVVGVGINVAMPVEAEKVIDQPWVDLVPTGQPFSRNLLAGRLLHHLLDAMHAFQNTGLVSFMRDWDMADLLSGKAVKLLHPGEEIPGISRGIALDGALLLEVDGKVQHFNYGEVSVRLLDAAS